MARRDVHSAMNLSEVIAWARDVTTNAADESTFTPELPGTDVLELAISLSKIFGYPRCGECDRGRGCSYGEGPCEKGIT